MARPDIFSYACVPGTVHVRVGEPYMDWGPFAWQEGKEFSADCLKNGRKELEYRLCRA